MGLTLLKIYIYLFRVAIFHGGLFFFIRRCIVLMVDGRK